MYQELDMRFKQPLIVNTNYWFTLMGMDELKRRLRAFLPLVSLYMSLLLIKYEMQKKEFYLAI